jgi:GGDEF domain-containing protein
MLKSDSVLDRRTVILAGNFVLLAALVVLHAAGMPWVFSALVATAAAVIDVALWRAAPAAESSGPSRADRLLGLIERSNDARRNAIRDESTGLLSRWYFERRLDEEAARCRRYGYKMSVVVLKAAIVDLAGISVDGWQVESASAAYRCAEVVRNVDLAAGLGPFEFAICLIHCDLAGAHSAISRLVTQLPEYACSAGVGVYPDDRVEPQELIQTARARIQG